MNIKSLILGSAVTALAATGAQAADAIIIAEPEPVEYVRVCDVYGAGYFYIPGTETCLRVSGGVRHQLQSGFSGKVVESGTVAGTTTTVRVNTRERGLHQGTGARSISMRARKPNMARCAVGPSLKVSRTIHQIQLTLISALTVR